MVMVCKVFALLCVLLLSSIVGQNVGKRIILLIAHVPLPICPRSHIFREVWIPHCRLLFENVPTRSALSSVTSTEENCVILRSKHKQTAYYLPCLILILWQVPNQPKLARIFAKVFEVCANYDGNVKHITRIADALGEVFSVLTSI